MKERSIVVTGGGRGVGRGIVELPACDQYTKVVVIERDEATTGWVAALPLSRRSDQVRPR